ncbi:MAG: NADH-quinone oxidoreductase subunit C [Lachnospiraceae bacterium]|nr:NADH-quinone oxidoreductase subunit C [Lachnospiraceae bacterium]
MNIKEVTADTILKEAQAMKIEKYRLIQICATKVEEGNIELLYTFGDRNDEAHFRFVTDGKTPIPSISHLYWPAFLYENEIHDLYGIHVDNMVLDYRGGLYRTAEKAPMVKE